LVSDAGKRGGQSQRHDQLLKGVKLGDRSYKNHLDGYDQTALLQGKGPSERHEFFYFAGPHLGAMRIGRFQVSVLPPARRMARWQGDDRHAGMVNIRQDPFERTPSINSENLNNLGGGYMNDFYAREFWRFVLVQQKVAELAKTAVDYPPMQDPASFNLEAVKQQIEAVTKNKPGQ
jgi:arylsulfatase